MKRFTNHAGDTWGEFLDIKNYDFDKIRPEKYNGKTILFSSVTDPYTPLESKYKITQRILEQLVGTKADIEILTKSKLVERDIELFKKFDCIRVGVSLNTLDDNIARTIEPRASKPSERLRVLQNIANNGISTYIFVSPIFPRVSNLREIIEAGSAFTDDFGFENLNFRGHNVGRIMDFIKRDFPHEVDYYNEIRKDPTLWDPIEDEIRALCSMFKTKCKIEFHHGGFSKS